MNKYVCYIKENGIKSVRDGECIVFENEHEALAFCKNHSEWAYVDFKYMWSNTTIADICKMTRTMEQSLSEGAKEEFVKMYDLCKYIQNGIGNEAFCELADLLEHEWELEFAFMVMSIADELKK